MSITPAMNASEPPPEPGPNESAIVRRWLWRQASGFFRAAVFLSLGGVIGIYIGGKAVMDTAEKIEAARIAEQNRYATVLVEPNQGQEIIMGALALLLGAPTGVMDIAKGLAPPQPRWIMKGKQKPMSTVPGASFSWVNLETRQTEGPFKPEVPQ